MYLVTFDYTRNGSTLTQSIECVDMAAVLHCINCTLLDSPGYTVTGIFKKLP